MNELSLDSQELLALLQQLIRVESVNPSLVAGGSGESGLARFIGDYLAQLGLGVTYQEVAPGRYNVIAVLKGTGQGPALMLNGHTDTVGIAGMDIEPLVPALNAGRVYGRGSLDMKGGLAAMIMAVRTIIQAGIKLKGDVMLACVADEEYASLGTETLIKEFTADAAIICEPTDLAIGIAHKGFAWIKVEVFGKAAHGSRPEEGVDAIVKAGKVLAELEKLPEAVYLNRRHPLLGSPSIHASLIAGGTELSTYPAYCKIELERRTLPGENIKTVTAEIEDLLEGIRRRDPEFKANYDIFFYRSPLEVAKDETIVRCLANAYSDVRRSPAGYTGFSGWMDSALLAEAGIPAAIFGPAGQGLHSAVEYVDLASVETTAAVLMNTIINFCKIQEKG